MPKASIRRTKLFISYKRGIVRDLTLARAIDDNLSASGCDVFMDVDIPVGAKWAAEIDQRIVHCDYLIGLLSREAAASEMVQAEVRLAHQCRKGDDKPVILPIRVDNDERFEYGLDAYLGPIQHLSWNGDQDTPLIVASLTERIVKGRQSKLHADQPPPPIIRSDAGDSRRPLSSTDPRGLLPPGGSLCSDDAFYVRRDADQHIDRLSQLSGQTLCIQAPRQMGKSSLLVRYLAQGKKAGKRLIWVDFQSFSKGELSDFSTLLHSLAQILLRQFGLEPQPGLIFASQRDFTYFMEDKLLANSASPVMIGFDEVDRLLGRPYQSDFFSMLRLWHNGRALPNSRWEAVDLALVIATEPYLLIAEADRSPFNVTPPIELAPFRRDELDLLNKAYDSLLDAAQVDRLYKLLSGHPYLTRLAYYRMLSQSGLSFQQLIDRSADIDGPFGEHLRSKMFFLQQQNSLLSAMNAVCSGKAQLDDGSYHRLHGAGLIVRHKKQAAPANQLYAKFFK
jgi:hypothetical protein